MPKIAENVFDCAKEAVCDEIEDMITTLSLVRAHVRVAKTKADIDEAVKKWSSSLNLKGEVNRVYEALLTPPKRKTKEKVDTPKV
jgi:hypothetical protein